MSARPFHPRMNHHREIPGWVLALVAVLCVAATGWVENASPGAMAALFHTVGLIAWWALIAVAVIVTVGLWIGVLVHCWRRMDGPR